MSRTFLDCASPSHCTYHGRLLDPLRVVASKDDYNRLKTTIVKYPQSTTNANSCGQRDDFVRGPESRSPTDSRHARCLSSPFAKAHPHRHGSVSYSSLRLASLLVRAMPKTQQEALTILYYVSHLWFNATNSASVSDSWLHAGLCHLKRPLGVGRLRQSTIHSSAYSTILQIFHYFTQCGRPTYRG